MKRVTITNVTDAWVDAFLKMVSAIDAVSGHKDAVINIEMEGATQEPKQRQPKVRYRAISGADALEAIGATTVRGIIYAHLLQCGPCTEREIREAKAMGRKGVESAIDKLKTMGVVIAEPIPEAEQR